VTAVRLSAFDRGDGNVGIVVATVCEECSALVLNVDQHAASVHIPAADNAETGQ
jgi:hypothetical protein